MLAKTTLFSFLLVLSNGLSAKPATLFSEEKAAQRPIQKFYQKLSKIPPLSMNKRVEYFSKVFLHQPYLLGALGEGRQGQYDQYPLYRLDAFDCETYVDTVLALAFATNFNGFKSCIRKIRYKEGNAQFIYRNHFASLDWNINNQKAGFVKDITTLIKDKNGQSVALYAQAKIDKPAWYQHFPLSRIRGQGLSKKEQTSRLQSLKKAGLTLEAVHAKIAYIPLSRLFNENQRPNLSLLKQIPNASIIEIVRPNWNLKNKIGTCLNVSHLGFGIWKDGILYFRQASSTKGKVIDTPLIHYLQKSLKSPTIKGINVQIVSPKTAVDDHCMMQRFQ